MSADLLELAEEWARDLPRTFVERLAAALGDGAGALGYLEAMAVLAPSRAALEHAKLLAARGDGPFLAGALAGLLRAKDAEAMVVPVWTGPEPEIAAAAVRLTLAVLADLLAEARREVVLVSYATQPSPALRDALSGAVGRGVAVRALLERRADNPRFFGDDTIFGDLPVERLCWPGERRSEGASMHAKILVVDRLVALVGSANLTGSGAERNLECGLLVRGGPVPGRLVDYLDALAAAGLLQPVG